MNLKGKKSKAIGIRRVAKFDAKDLLGTPFSVILHDSVDEKYDLESGEPLSHVIPNVRSLIAAVAVMRASKQQKLNGEEIRFLRKSLARKAKEFAEDVGISAEQLSRYENDRQAIPLIYERVLRASVCLGHFDQAYELRIDMKNLLAMRITPVRPVGEACVLDLSLASNMEHSKPPTDDLPQNDQAWRKTG